MTKKIPVMCTCPYVLLQWFSASLYSPSPSSPLLVCVSLPFPSHTPLSSIKSALVHALVSSLVLQEKPFCECCGMRGCLPAMCVLYSRLNVVCVCVSGWKAFDVQPQPCVFVCGRRLVNGAMTSRVTSLITSVTFSQMSFLCN